MARLAEILLAFHGEQVQTPPAFSAVKVRGRPAYWWARRDRPVTLAPRTVRIFELSVLTCEPDAITVRVRCSAGTYVRSLGQAIAQALGTVGHLSRLLRLRVGAYSLEDARPLSWIEEASRERLLQELRPVPAAPPSGAQRVGAVGRHARL
jgi:tRNA pseudouridine55 synthase